MDNLIKTYDDILDNQTCNNIIDKFEQFENQHEEFDDKGMIFTQIRMAKSPQIWSKEIETFTKINQIDGKVYPEEDFNENDKLLKGFYFREDERIKTIQDLFSEDSKYKLIKINQLQK